MDLCSKCGVNPRYDADSTSPWCKDCRTKYQKEYARTIKYMTESRGFAAGVSAFRDHVAKKFESFPARLLIDARQAAQWVRTEPFTLPQD